MKRLITIFLSTWFVMIQSTGVAVAAPHVNLVQEIRPLECTYEVVSDGINDIVTVSPKACRNFVTELVHAEK